MTSRVATRIALTSLTASLALGIAAVAWQADRGDAGASATLAAATAAMLAFAAVGVAIVRRHPANSIGWIFSASALLMLGADAAGAYIDGGDLERTGATLAAWLANWCWISGLGLLGTFVTLLFPDGRPPSRRWRPLVWAGGIALAAGLTGVALADGPIDAGYPDNPLGVPNADVLQVALLAIPMMTVAGIAGQAVRYRRGTPTDRQQLRLVAVTLTAVVAFLLIASAAGETGIANTPDAVYLLAFAAVPVSIGLAILRHGLYEIDVIIRRTLVYTGLVASLAAVYLAGITGIGWLLRDAAGQSSALAVTISTLLVAAAFQPLRHRIQRAVDHRFYRGRYDADHAIGAFSARLREQIDLDALSSELLATVDHTVQPTAASLWLRAVTIPERPTGTTEVS